MKHVIKISVEGEYGVGSIALQLEDNMSEMTGPLITMLSGVSKNLVGIQQVVVDDDGVVRSMEVPIEMLRSSFGKINSLMDGIDDISLEEKEKIINELERRLKDDADE